MVGAVESPRSSEHSATVRADSRCALADAESAGLELAWSALEGSVLAGLIVVGTSVYDLPTMRITLTSSCIPL